MSTPVITVENLSKCYIIGHQRSKVDGLRHTIEHAIRNPLSLFKARRKRLAEEETEDFWALKDISFSIKQGEAIGIIGRNGAGKSTLLKILSRITEPTSGRIRIKGRVASLLEVGTGFHQELTGRENIFLNGAILGMAKTEIKRKFDEIVAFSEVEKFLDTPVKRYSSGMYVRLAFAVAAHLEPEILIVDEVLAVGDVEFQKKCLGKMEDVAIKDGRTVLFVSHNMAAVSRLCQTGLLLDKGVIAAKGNAHSIVARYLQSDTGEKAQFIPNSAKQFAGNETATLVALAVRTADGSLGPTFISVATLTVEITYRVLKPVRGLRVGFHLHSADGTIIFNTTDADSDEAGADTRTHRPGVYMSSCAIPSGLLNYGQYSLTVGCDTPTTPSFYVENAVCFFIVPDGGNVTRGSNRPGFVRPRLSWEIQSISPSASPSEFAQVGNG